MHCCKAGREPVSIWRSIASALIVVALLFLALSPAVHAAPVAAVARPVVVSHAVGAEPVKAEPPIPECFPCDGPEHHDDWACYWFGICSEPLPPPAPPGPVT